MRAVDEVDEFFGDVGEGRLVGEVGRADAVDCLRLRMDLTALRVDVSMKAATGREAVHQFDAAELDDALVAPVQPCRLGIEDDFPHHRISFSFAEKHGMGGAHAASSALPPRPSANVWVGKLPSSAQHGKR